MNNLMELFFSDSNEIPLPPEDVRIVDITLEPYPDGRRIRCFIELTPFLKKPHGDIQITDQLGRVVSEASFIEAVTPKFEMVLHLRSLDPAGEYQASLTLYYSEEIEDEIQEARTLVRPEKVIVDQKTFVLQIGEK
jgi:hypothetical protein